MNGPVQQGRSSGESGKANPTADGITDIKWCGVRSSGTGVLPSAPMLALVRREHGRCGPNWASANRFDGRNQRRRSTSSWNSTYRRPLRGAFIKPPPQGAVADYATRTRHHASVPAPSPPRSVKAGWAWLYRARDKSDLGAAVVVATALMALRSRSDVAGPRLAFAGFIVVMAAGTFWFVQRVFFPGGMA